MAQGIRETIAEYRRTQKRALAIIALVQKERQGPAPDEINLKLLETWLSSATKYLEENKPKYERALLIREVLDGE